MLVKFYDIDNCVHLKLNDRTEEEALKIAKEVDSEFIQLNMNYNSIL